MLADNKTSWITKYEEKYENKISVSSTPPMKMNYKYISYQFDSKAFISKWRRHHHYINKCR